MRTPGVQASAPPAPPAPPAPKPAAPQGFSMGGGLGGGLFDKLKALVEPVDVGGSSAPKAKADAIYEDDEMAGGMGKGVGGTKKVGSPNVPFRPTFTKEDDK
jgi:hypothetical protein